jgi:hypothetical protein
LLGLQAVAHQYGGDVSARKVALLAALERSALANARAVERLHEILLFLRAYPDDAAVLHTVERLLGAFDSRRDLRRFARTLAQSGIAGTAIHYRFFWFTAEWLARRWPDQLTIDWREFANAADLEPLLRLLVPAAESAALDGMELRPRQWIERWRAREETDAVFLVRRFAALRMDDFGREMLYERLDPPLRLAPGRGTPSRTRARAPGSSIVYRRHPLDRTRPDLRRAARLPPRAVRDVSPRTARALIELARGAMVTRSRDLDSFEHADPADVRLVDCGEGLELVCIGLVPERRALLDAIYGYLTLQSGVPIGYVLSSALFESALVAYNVFETFRGAEAARHYGRVLAAVRTLFGADTFAVDPYQLGHDNAEGQASGAWWFYYKLGFRPHDAAVRRLVRNELDRQRQNARYRSPRRTLQRLSAAHLFLALGRERSDVLGSLRLENISLRISEFLAKRGGARREAGIRDCAEEAAARFGARAWRRWPNGERLAWQRWAPVLLLVPDPDRWSASERADAVAVVRAKGGRRETDFVTRFDAHRRLRGAVELLARPLSAT